MVDSKVTTATLRRLQVSTVAAHRLTRVQEATGKANTEVRSNRALAMARRLALVDTVARAMGRHRLAATASKPVMVVPLQVTMAALATMTITSTTSMVAVIQAATKATMEANMADNIHHHHSRATAVNQEEGMAAKAASRLHHGIERVALAC